MPSSHTFELVRIEVDGGPASASIEDYQRYEWAQTGYRTVFVPPEAGGPWDQELPVYGYVLFERQRWRVTGIGEGDILVPTENSAQLDAHSDGEPLVTSVWHASTSFALASTPGMVDSQRVADTLLEITKRQRERWTLTLSGASGKAAAVVAAGLVAIGCAIGLVGTFTEPSGQSTDVGGLIFAAVVMLGLAYLLVRITWTVSKTLIQGLVGFIISVLFWLYGLATLRFVRRYLFVRQVRDALRAEASRVLAASNPSSVSSDSTQG
ncbi:MAG: hypothetical protein AAFU73_15655 [Planctomycetota bacterium]